MRTVALLLLSLVLVACQQPSTSYEGAESTYERLEIETEAPEPNIDNSTNTNINVWPKRTDDEGLSIYRWRVIPEGESSHKSVPWEVQVVLAAAMAVQPVEERTFPIEDEAAEYLKTLERKGVKARIVKEKITAKGAGLQTNSPDVALDFDASAPGVVGSTGASATGGSTSLAAAFKNPVSIAAIMVVLGGLALLGGIAIFFGAPMFKRMGVGLAIGGAALIGTGVVATTYPWAFLAGGILALVGVGWMLWDYREASRTLERVPELEEESDTLQKVTRVIPDMSPPAKAEYREIASKVMNQNNKETIRRVR